MKERFANLLSILCSLFLFFTYKKKKYPAALPVCTCKENLACPTPISDGKCNIDIGENSFTLHQCKICGGVSGCPQKDFQNFLSTASEQEKKTFIEKFYSCMQSPL